MRLTNNYLHCVGYQEPHVKKTILLSFVPIFLFSCAVILPPKKYVSYIKDWTRISGEDWRGYWSERTIFLEANIQFLVPVGRIDAQYCDHSYNIRSIDEEKRTSLITLSKKSSDTYSGFCTFYINGDQSKSFTLYTSKSQ
jgi:hypothetical protein